MADFEFKAPVDRRTTIQRIATIVICALLIIILIWAIVHHFQKAAKEEPASLPDTAQNKGADQDSTPPSGPTAPADNGDSPANSSSPSSTSGDSAASSSRGDQATKLTDTGPGDTVAIFVGAVIVGSVGFQLRTRRQLARSQN